MLYKTTALHIKEDEQEYIDPEQGFDCGEQVFFRKLFLMVDK